MDRSPSKPCLREQVSAVRRVHHYSIRTEQSYWYWIRYFIRFHRLRHPMEMGAVEVSAFLTWLAADRKVAAATQNLALNALVFLYTKVLDVPLGQLGEVVRAKRSTRIPCVLTHAEATTQTKGVEVIYWADQLIKGYSLRPFLFILRMT